MHYKKPITCNYCTKNEYLQYFRYCKRKRDEKYKNISQNTIGNMCECKPWFKFGKSNNSYTGPIINRKEKSEIWIIRTRIILSKN